MTNEPGPGTATHDLVVIGASAGGVDVLRRVVSDLPPDLPAAVCVVLHISPNSPSALAEILARAGPLPCRVAADGEALRAGEIIVAPPDRHLEIGDGVVRVSAGPRESGHRPSVDRLFRTAATARRRQVAGVVLSGNQDDGAAGLAAIKEHGGAAIVQSPDEAVHPAMPRNAIASVTADAIAPSALIGETIARVVRGQALPQGARTGAEAASAPR